MAKRRPSLTPRQRCLARLLLGTLALDAPGQHVSPALVQEWHRLTQHRPVPWTWNDVAAHFSLSVADLKRILELP